MNGFILSNRLIGSVSNCLRILSNQSIGYQRSVPIGTRILANNGLSVRNCSHNLSAADVKHKELSLRNEMVQRIKAVGPLTIADYMKMVLTHPISGFYMKDDVFGTKGHFTTSPEISQIFGELIAVWLLNEWQRNGCPKPLRVVELGPGRGTLANDVGRVLSQFSHSKDVTSLHLIEISPHLTQIQEQNICGTVSLIEQNENAIDGRHSALTKTGLPITWYRSLDQMPVKSGFTAIIAHEFLDALPIHKFVRSPSGEWREVLIDCDTNNELRYIIAKNATPASKLFIDPAVTGDNYEVCPQSALVMDEVIARFSHKNPGCFLVCDYGYEDNNQSRDTFRAFKNHQNWDPLKEPGTADLTADVDFGYLKRHIKDKATVFGTVSQQHFLKSLGVELRLSQLLAQADEQLKSELQSGVDMLLKDMGDRYKFMAVFPSNYKKTFLDNPPAGFF